MAVNVLSVDELYKKNLASSQANRNSDIAKSNEIYKQQGDTLTSIYEGTIADNEKEYEDLNRVNDVQKLINEREVAENMANLGLTDSGLNRTQQTAVILSHSNERSRIAREKQAMVNSLTRELTSKLSENETDRANAELAINKQYDTEAMSAAVSENASQWDAYNKETEANQKNYEAYLKAVQEAEERENKITKLEYGTLSGSYNTTNGNIVYTDTKGREVKMKQGANPYTGKINKDALDDDGKYDSSLVFSNGYQPNNINGDPLKKANKKINKTTVPWRTDGVEQQVWMADGKYYLWHGPSNKYVQARYNSKEEAWEFKL